MQLSRRSFVTGALSVGATALFPAGGALGRARPAAPFPELTLSGSPGTLGLGHGKRFAPLVRKNLAFYLGWLGKAAGNKERAELLGLARGFLGPLREHLPAQLEEMEGIARGAKVPLIEVVAMNARTDMLVMGRRSAARRAASASERVKPGCTALALRGGSGGAPRLALGQNWDWVKALDGGTVLLRLKPKGGPALVTFTEAGMVGKIGLNEHGLGVCLNFLSHNSEDPNGPYGLPVHNLLRAVMGCQTLEEAYKLVAWAPRCASANFLMAQQRGKRCEAVDLEWTPTAVGRIPWQQPGLVHTNHFVDPALRPGCTGAGGRSTENRYKTALERAAALRGEVSDPVSRMRQVLACRQGAPYAVSKTPAVDSSSLTLAGVVMDLAKNELHLCKGPPHAGRWVGRPGV